MSYRTDRVEIVRTFQYNDSASDHFEREPYSVLIRSREEGGGKIFLVLCRPHPLMAHAGWAQDKHFCGNWDLRGQSSFIKACSFGMLGVRSLSCCDQSFTLHIQTYIVSFAHTIPHFPLSSNRTYTHTSWNPHSPQIFLSSSLSVYI